ncbi:MAG: FKBP-type peptidyl-prolyl cis-trans isomerase [Bacteroidaceae bacterium]|nr:FKBP-type peptidyl-prolyl cis-trans isomerase [Bacteroidaceae bacterium]
MKRLLFISTALLLVGMLLSCSEENDNASDNEYADWKARNEVWFNEQMATAQAAIAQAQAVYGDDWQQHSEWLILRNYLVPAGAPATRSDSMPVQIVQRGSGSGSPLYTDTASVCYLGRLMPTELHPLGYPFSFTGTYPSDEQVFGEATRAPVKSAVSNNIAGFATALQQMHIGDRWRIFVHPDMAYGSNATTVIPAYSVLDFTIELRAYFKP